MNLEGLEYKELADRLLPAVLAAGRLEMSYFRTALDVTRKKDLSPVTLADQEAEALLHHALHEVAANIPVVAEEAAAAGRTPAVGERFFLVDPLDGTKSFIEGKEDFTVNVALIEHGRPTFGVVYAPVTGRLFAALGPASAVEAYARPDSAATSFADIAPAPIHTRQPDIAALSAVASRSHGGAATEAFLARWAVRQRLNVGSSLKFCLLARGDADVYPRFASIHEWDTAAGHAVLLAAGGTVTQVDGTELLYGKAAQAFLNPPFIAWGRRDLATLMTSANC